MDLSVARDTYLCLTFSEANIVFKNIPGLTKPALIARILELRDNTSDTTLKEDASLLLWKLTQLSQDDYDRLVKDAEQGVLLFPANYQLTCSSSFSPKTNHTVN